MAWMGFTDGWEAYKVVLGARALFRVIALHGGSLCGGYSGFYEKSDMNVYGVECFGKSEL